MNAMMINRSLLRLTSLLNIGRRGVARREAERLILLSDAGSKDVLARTRVITEAAEASAVVHRLLASGEPVGVDMEGVVNGAGVPTSLIQVADSDKNIFLFRTGINQSLYREGRLKELLEAPYITKVMHASSVDCMSVYKDGIKMWGLYDTAVAHKVLELQTNGSSVHNAQTLSLNGLCSYCGLEKNPFKDLFRDTLWKLIVYKNILHKKEKLPEEMILYCAWDVATLLDIHQSLRALIDKDFAPFVDLLSEIELIRSIDKELARRKRTSWKNFELTSLFLSGLPPTANKADIFGLITDLGGHKQVFHAYTTNSALLALDCREEALQFLAQNETARLRSLLGPDVQMRLVAEAVKEESEGVVEGEVATAEAAACRLNNGCIAEAAACRSLIEALMVARVPVVVDFHHYKPDISTVELFVGTGPPFPILVNPQTIQEGQLGLFFSSGANTKVVFRTDTSSTYAVLKRLTMLGHRPSNLFDLTTAFRILSFIHRGQSVFRSNSPSIQTMCEGLGLSDPDTSSGLSRLGRYYRSHLVLKRLLAPSVAAAFLAAKTEIDARIGGGGPALDLSREKQRRKELRAEWEVRALHLRPVKRNVEKTQLVADIEECLRAHAIYHKQILDLGCALLLQLASAEDVEKVEQLLSTWHLTAHPDRELVVTLPDRPPPVPPEPILGSDIRLPAKLLDTELAANLSALERSEFFQAPPVRMMMTATRTHKTSLSLL